MEQEPVYVPSGKLIVVCEDALGRIYDLRRARQQEYVEQCVQDYNNIITARNRKRRWWNKILGLQPEMYITPQGMELEMLRQVQSLSPQKAEQHPMIQIQETYGRLEHEAKDAIIMAQLSDMVPISSDFARGLSHLGVDPGFMRKEPFGFRPR